MNNIKRTPAVAAFTILAAFVCGGIYTIVKADGATIAPENIQTVALAADPLYAQGTGQKPTLTLALSVEFPTVGAQYRDSFNAANKYLGYFDVNSCYAYVDGSNTAADWKEPNVNIDKFFKRVGAAAEMRCGGVSFSGNFMNWASASSVDLLRFGLTGGDRLVDLPNLTVLQRAVLKTDFWNSGAYFPQKSINNAIAKTVVPTGLLGEYTGDVYISNCLDKIFFSNNKSTGSCGTPTASNSLGAKVGTPVPANKSVQLSTGMFVARVNVCSDADPRTNLCQRYPNGNMKPVGNMQKYSDRVRLSAFGYLMQDGNQRYGGVLRAPMSYVGAKSYDADGNAVAGLNPTMEWDLTTGVFGVNPLNAPEGNSGVINYLNKFGRNGIYKSNDPVGEMYYESLRYLQGLQPTSQAVSGLTDANKAGFPAYANWVDPFANDLPGNKANEKNYACLRNSIFLIGDVNTHNDKSLPGNTRTSNYDFNRTGDVSLAGNIPNFVDWTKVVGGFESGVGVSYLDGTGAAQTTSNPTTFKIPSLANMATADTGSNGAAYYMAGAAYWAHTHDIRGAAWSDAEKRRLGMRVSTYVLDVNENGTQSDWNTRKTKQFYLTAKYGGFDDLSGVGNPFTPPNSAAVYDNRQWAKVPGSATPDPKNYFLASDAQSVLDAIDNIFASATKVSNSIASPAASASKLTAGTDFFYMASFDPEYWSGDIRRNTIKTDGSTVVQGGLADQVSAAEKLDARSPSSRNIVVGQMATSGVSSANAFIWDQIGAMLQMQLNNGTTALVAGDGFGKDRLNFLRGDRSLEASNFRVRGSRMGDVINSGVTFSGAPSGQFNDTAYTNFYNANLSRAKAVFVGANDGMLHAFDATTMEEIFAYIPSWMSSKLSTLTNIEYNSTLHASYVDATPTVGEALVGTTWKTVLVSGTGGGGQGVFALDVTDPGAFDAGKLIWEFTDQNDADLGNVVGTVKLMKLRTNAISQPVATYKWYAVVPSGVNNYANDGFRSTTGKPALFFLDLSKDATSNWILGQNYFKVTFPFLSTVATGTAIQDAFGALTGETRATGVINFEATADEAGAVRYFYVPDLHGQLWKLDMSKANLADGTSASWDLTQLSVYHTASTPMPMFNAQTKGGKAQPISMAPTIAYGPSGSYLVAFGTGKYLEAKDNAINGNTLVQSFYNLYDVNNQTSFEVSNAGRRKLQHSTVSASAITTLPFVWTMPSDAALSNASEDAVLGAKKAGWYMDYPNGGSVRAEQQVSNAELFGTKIVFNSIMPPTASSSACSGGSSYTYITELASGSGSISPLINGAQGSPLVFRVSSTVGESDSVGQRTQTERVVLMSPSSTGDGQLSQSGALAENRLVGRLSWRQINNYRDLKNKSW